MSNVSNEEVYLASAIKDRASRLAMLAVAGDEIGLSNELEGMLTNAVSDRLRKDKKSEKYRKDTENELQRSAAYTRGEGLDRHASVVLEYVDKNAVLRVAKILGGEGDRATRSRTQLAQNMLRAYNSGSNSYVTMFKRAIALIKKHIGISEGLESVKALLREEESGTTAGPSKDRDTGEILYHLDMATRHLDVLVDYTLIAGHEDDIVKISTQVQRLAQVIRSELEATRTPYDEV